jgi:protein-S-isoprenylcysteine O-methyltransferase Ste14
MSKNPNGDVPGVIIFPPIIIFATIVLSLFLQQLFPIQTLSHIDWQLRWTAGFALAIIGPLLTASAIQAMARLGTNVSPSSPTTALVTHGVFRFTRNPIYLGGLLLMVGLALVLANGWLVVLFLPSQLILHWGVVLPEERYLEAKFGDAYLTYKAETPQYFWPI